MRTTKCLSLEQDLLQQVESTKGEVSTSERVNNLLKTALEWERKQNLYTEAELFFAVESEEDRGERRGFQAASLRSLARED